MAGAFAPFGFLNLWLPFVALELFSFLNSQCGAGSTTSDQATLLDSAAEVLPPLAAVGALFAAVALTYRHLMSRHVAAVTAGNGRRSISGLVTVIFALCVSAGTLEFIVFGGQAAGGGAGRGAQARALGLAAFRALPAAATVTFFCGMMLVVASAALVRAGGEAGGTGGVAGDGPMQGLLRLLTKIAAGAAAALVGLMAMALTAKS